MRVSNQPDWKTVRESIDLAEVATRLLGPAPGRRGAGGRKLWWSCPFHEDRNPSFCVDPGKTRWKCWGCGESGDAANLVMKLEGKTFPEAVASLVGRSAHTSKPPTRPAKAPSPKPTPERSGLPEAEALALVEEAAERLWKPEGEEALAYLTGPRGLSVETIRTNRIGWTPEVSIPTRDGDRYFHALGWVIPWFTGDKLALVKIRQPDGRQPKYMEAYREPTRLLTYPDPKIIRQGRPVIVVEGEFDALALGEALGDLAAVLTLGSASFEPSPAVLSRLLPAYPWYIATDADEAGDRVIEKWPRHAIRARPPTPDKDWTEARAAGVNLYRWWTDLLAGNPIPPRFTADELDRQRWGPGLEAD